jgi:exopolysaccharide biosynthesis protein
MILVRLDARAYDIRLAANVGSDGVGRPWTIASAPAAARVALNAGQFTDDGPWGWVVHHGRELRPPGEGSLAMAVVVDTLGAVRLLEAERVAEARARGGIVEAFQSYPALLVGDGEVPLPLRERGRGVELDHRDSRLAIGELRDGRILLALTRFDALGGKLSELPFGPTLPELAAIMGALGCARAVALDGGISGQLLVRERDGSDRAWRGLRAVPLGLAVFPRPTP